MNTSSVPTPLSRTNLSWRNVLPTFFISLLAAVTVWIKHSMAKYKGRHGFYYQKVQLQKAARDRK